MSDLQAPIINWQVMAGDSKAGFAEQRILLIAHSDGSAPYKELLEDVQQTEVDDLLGVGCIS